MNPRVLVLLSQLGGNGGIPRYNRLLCKTLGEYQRVRQLRLDVVSLNDQRGWFDKDVLPKPVDGATGKRPLFVVKAVRAQLRRYNLVIVGHVDLSSVAMLPHLLHPNASMVAVVHGEEVWGRLPWHKRAGLQQANRVWAVSEHTKSELVRNSNVPADRVHVVPNVLDPAFATEADRPGKGLIRSRLLTISRLVRANGSHKGVDHVISALPAIRSVVPDVDYTIIGGGDDVPRLRSLAQSLGVDQIVTFGGQVSDLDLHRYLGGTDVFVLPSRQEGFGIVFLEAMAYSKPVVAGAHGGSPEVVLDGITGNLVQYGDQASLVQSLVALLRDPSLRDRLGAAGAERVRTTFSYDRFVSAVFAMLDDSLGRLGE